MKRKGLRLIVIKDGDDGRSSKGKEETPENQRKGQRKMRLSHLYLSFIIIIIKIPIFLLHTLNIYI